MGSPDRLWVGIVAADQPGMVGVILFIRQLLKHYEDKEDTSTIFHLQFKTEYQDCLALVHQFVQIHSQYEKLPERTKIQINPF